MNSEPVSTSGMASSLISRIAAAALMALSETPACSSAASSKNVMSSVDDSLRSSSAALDVVGST